MVLGRQTLFGNGALQEMRKPLDTQHELGEETTQRARELSIAREEIPLSPPLPEKDAARGGTQ